MIVPYSQESPAVSHTHLPQIKYVTVWRCIAEWRKQLSRSWSSLHLSSRGGKYSIERLLALEEYTRNTSLLRAVLVCVATPLPAILVVLVLESLPIQDPAVGWSSNYGYWLRGFFVTAGIATNILVHVRCMVNGCIVSMQQLIKLVLGVSILETIICMTFAAWICFPIPFVLITMAPPFYPIISALFYSIVGLPVLREMLKHSSELTRFMNFASAQQTMTIIYPAYQVLFHTASKNYELEVPVILLLPVVKLLIKYVCLLCMTHMEDIMPESVIFSVDFFNALYLSTSVESASSTSTIVIIVLIDSIRSIRVLHQLHRQISGILLKVNEIAEKLQDNRNLLIGVRHLCEQTKKFQRQNLQHIRVHSCFQHRISQGGRELLSRLEKICKSHKTCRSSALQSGESIAATSFGRCDKIPTGLGPIDRARQVAVVPTSTTASPTIPNLQAMLGNQTTDENKNLDVLRESLEILFTTECVVLSAYLDTFVPLFYTNYVIILVYLPSAQYHTEMVGVTPENVRSRANPVFLFFVVELISFMLLAALIYRRIGYRAVYHLAFVLETHKQQIQTKLVAWVLATMAFRIIHFGVDFTFKFDWLKDST